ncbi:MAG: glycosyltransferase 61 family protein [Cyanobium sp.]
MSEDYAVAARAALQPKLRRQLAALALEGKRIAYLSRHKLANGTSKFIQEGELVEQLRTISRVDIIYPEELNFEEKLSLCRSHSYIVGFPQGCMMLKPFVPCEEPGQIAGMIFLVAGPKCLPRNWLSVEKVCRFGDFYHDCHGQPEHDPDPNTSGFTRANSIDVPRIVKSIRELAASLS